ncbi:MAG: hypothetical protein HY717_16650 [Planctomycetes bacterium]|nr:hypothetical protein [Planctomycetota bacterium]
MNPVKPAPPLVKASLAHLETLEAVDVLWNPAQYRLSRQNRFLAGSAPPRLAGAGAGSYEGLQVAASEEWFETRLFIDTTDAPPGPARNARAFVEKIARWMVPLPGSVHPPRVVFIWGPMRFAGAIESMDEEWLRFDPDGTPVRAWVALRLRKR